MLQTHGLEAIFPVADTTDLGRVAIASEEILYPEIARVCAPRGAEVLHASSEVASPLSTPSTSPSRRGPSRASPMGARQLGIKRIDLPTASPDASCKGVDLRGLMLAQASQGESMAAHAKMAALAGQEAQAPDGLLAADGLISPTRGFQAQRQCVREALAGMI